MTTEAAAVLAFPLVPLLAAAAALSAQVLARRDWTKWAVRWAAVAQLGLAVAMAAAVAGGAPPLRFAVSAMPLSIELAFGADRLGLCAAYAAPLALCIGRVDQLAKPALRLLLLFYMGGCAGAVVAGDVFNFFVFYEVMTMAAYVLVAARERYYAATKYMLFGAAGSICLLAGIVLVHGSGAGLSLPYGDAWTAAPSVHRRWTLHLMAAAFLIKSAFFPCFTWLVSCHVATVPVVSAFLASFTAAVGVWGLEMLVVAPAIRTGEPGPLGWLTAVSAMTMIAPAVVVLLEKNFKRCVAGSTVVTIGLGGLLLARGRAGAAMTLVAAHGVVKALLFHLTADAGADGLILRARRSTLAALAACAWMASGVAPAATFFLKAPLREAGDAWAALSTTAALAVAAGFWKFRWRVDPEAPGTALPWACALALPAVVALPARTAAAGALPAALVEAIALSVTALAAARLRQWLEPRDPVGRVHRALNLNVELLLAVLLWLGGMIWIVGLR